MLSVDGARTRMLAGIQRFDFEDVPLHLLDGRTLSASIHATRDQPPFDASIMDGYALRAADAPGSLKIVGEAAAGHAFGRKLDAGEAVRISTGAPLPDGADAVIAQEEVTVTDAILNAHATTRGAFVRPRGGDFAARALLLEAGRVIDATAIMALGGAGLASARVTRKPIVTVLANGDELVAPGDAPRDDQIFDSATYAVASLARAWGAETKTPPRLTDNKAVIKAALKSALTQCDVLAIIGGASVGPHDHIRTITRELGGALRVEGVAMRPGRPTWFAALPDGKFAIGLPGNPASALVCARIFLAAIIETMLSGGQTRSTTQFTRKLSSPMPANGAREAYVRAIAQDCVVEPILNEDSSMMSVLARSNCLVRRLANSDSLAVGAEVDCVFWSPST